MADKIKAIKIKQKNGTYSEEVPISVNVQNVQWDENNHTLLDALGSVDISSSGKGNLQHQIDELDGDKISTNQFNSRLNNFLREQISADTTDWLDDNVNPVGSAVIVDKTLTIEGAAADALAVKTELNKKANASNTYTKAEVNAAIDAKKIEVDDTLSITGTAADAKAVGDELTAVKADLDAKGLNDDIKAALINVVSHIGVWTDEHGQDYVDALYESLFPDGSLEQLLITSDFFETRGLSNFSVTDGNVYYNPSTAKTYSVAALNIGIDKVIADINDSSGTFPPQQWLVFSKVNADTYYVTDSNKLFIFKYNSTTGVFDATEDNTIATLIAGEDTTKSNKIKVTLSDGVLKYYNGETHNLIYSITGANCLGFWLGNSARNGCFWNNAKVHYAYRPVTLSDITEKRTVPEITVNAQGTITCGSANTYWLVGLNQNITEIKYLYGASSRADKLWLVYKKLDNNNYCCTDGYHRFIFAYNSSTGYYDATNADESTTATLINPDKRTTQVGAYMCITASIKNNTVKIMGGYGYGITIQDANCLGVWGQVANNTFQYFMVKEGA